jgi:tetratricopeptide (TPR) repeat protein
MTLGDNCNLPAREAFSKAKAYVMKALEIDAGTLEAHYALSSIKRCYEWDWEGAERECQEGLRIDPRDADAHAVYAMLLNDLGKHEEAIKEQKLARGLNPLDHRIRANVGLLLYFARKYAEAEQVLKKELEFEPNNCIVYVNLQKLYTAMGRYEEALEFGSSK